MGNLSGGGDEKRNVVGADDSKEPLDHGAFIAKWKSDSPDSAGKEGEELDKAAEDAWGGAEVEAPPEPAAAEEAPAAEE